MLAAILALFAFASCEHKELCYSHPHEAALRVCFDFAASGLPDGQTRSMRVHFYPANGKEPYTFDFPKGKSRTVSLPTGNYRAVCFNNDTQYIDWQGEQQAQSLLATTEQVKTPEGTEAYSTPDRLMGSSLEQVHIEPENGTEQVVTFTPTPKVCRYSFEVHGIKEVQYITDMRVCLSGMSGQLLMFSDSFPPHTDDDTLLASGDLKDGLCTGAFYTFGHATESGTQNLFTLYVKNRKDKVQKAVADVTEQVWSVPTTGHLADVHLVIRIDLTIDNDKPGGSGSGAGFEVGVDNWGDIHEDIIL